MRTGKHRRVNRRATSDDASVRNPEGGLRVVPRGMEVEAAKAVSDWTRRYGERHAFKRINAPGLDDGRLGRVTLYERCGNVLMRWFENGKNSTDTIRASEYDDILTEALLRAAEINGRLESKRRSGAGFSKATVREACKALLASKEASPDCHGSTIKKYRQELSRVMEFAETTPEGRRCKFVHEINSEWCQEFSRWLNAYLTTPNGGPVTERNPSSFYSRGQKQGIRRRLSNVIEHGMQLNPPLVPRDTRSPITRDFIGRRIRRANSLSGPPVTVEELATITTVLDAYALALLAPLFLYGARPSELGHILVVDYRVSDSMLCMLSRPATGYTTKAGIDKYWPMTEPLVACLRPMLARDAGPIFVKRWIHEGKGGPALGSAYASVLALEFDGRRKSEAERLGHLLTKEEVDQISKRIWTEAGAVAARDVRRELRRAAKKVGLAHIPTPVDCRHLFESLCEEARLADGVIRHLMGHRPQRGDALHNYSHTTVDTLHEQIAILDKRRKPLLDALVTRASELAACHHA